MACGASSGEGNRVSSLGKSRERTAGRPRPGQPRHRRGRRRGKEDAEGIFCRSSADDSSPAQSGTAGVRTGRRWMGARRVPWWVPWARRGRGRGLHRPRFLVGRPVVVGPCIPVLCGPVLCRSSRGRPPGPAGVYSATARAVAARLLVLLPEFSGLLSVCQGMHQRVVDRRPALGSAAEWSDSVEAGGGPRGSHRCGLGEPRGRRGHRRRQRGTRGHHRWVGGQSGRGRERAVALRHRVRAVHVRQGQPDSGDRAIAPAQLLDASAATASVPV
jgi:hypothetical protein